METINTKKPLNKLKNHRLSQSILGLRFLLILLSFNACNDKQTPQDTGGIVVQPNQAELVSFDETDARFLITVTEINLLEIKLGQLAQNKSKMLEVKELGKMMEYEHGKTLRDLKILAAKKQIVVPTILSYAGENAYEKLMDKTTTNFDLSYCAMMVKDHQDAIDLFERASNSLVDANIKSWAISMVPILKNQLEQAANCQKKCEKM